MKRSFGFVFVFWLCLLAGTPTATIIAQTNPANWPEWRGPLLTGMALGDAPLVWSNTENIKWKAEIPGRGFSTPVIWGDRIFLTTAIPVGKPEATASQVTGTSGQSVVNQRGGNSGPLVEHKFDVLCVNRKTGKLFWQKTAKLATPHEGYHRAYGSFASNAPITDGKYLYAFFGSRGIYCYDFNGKLIWQQDLGVQMHMRLQFGEGSAPALDSERIYLTYDHDTGSFVVALDKRTGKEVWRAARDEQSSWSTPLVVEQAGRRQVVVSASKKVRSYDAQTGKIIWECAGLGVNVIPALIHHKGVIYAMSGYTAAKLMAIKLGGEGDLTGTEAVMWTQTRGLSYTLSPLLHDGRLWVVTDNGQVSCFDIATGVPYFQQVRLPRPYNFKASPVGANGKIYLASEDGDVIVLKMSDKLEVLATNKLEDQVFIASPVIVGGEIFLRSQNTLYCISDGKTK